MVRPSTPYFSDTLFEEYYSISNLRLIFVILEFRIRPPHSQTDATSAGHMVASHFKNMKSPTFRVVQESETRAFFYYTPGAKERVGLGPLVMGLVRAVAELQFGIMNLTMNQGKTQDDGTIEFLLEWEDDSTCSSVFSAPA